MAEMKTWRKLPMEVGVPFTKIFDDEDHDVATCFEESDADEILNDRSRASLAAELRRSISYAYVSEAAIFRFISARDALDAPKPSAAEIVAEPFEEAP